MIRVKWQPIDIGIDKLISDLNKEHWQVEVLDLDKKEQDFETVMKVVHQISPSMVVLASYFRYGELLSSLYPATNQCSAL